MPDAIVPHDRTARPASAIREIEVLWMTAGGGVAGINCIYSIYCMPVGGPSAGPPEPDGMRGKPAEHEPPSLSRRG
jgi:hypothetical protein